MSIQAIQIKNKLRKWIYVIKKATKFRPGTIIYDDVEHNEKAYNEDSLLSFTARELDDLLYFQDNRVFDEEEDK